MMVKVKLKSYNGERERWGLFDPTDVLAVVEPYYVQEGVLSCLLVRDGQQFWIDIEGDLEQFRKIIDDAI